MADYIITVSDDDAKIIQVLANRGGITGRAFVEQHISNFCAGQIQGYFIEKIRSKTTEELIALLGDIQ